MLVSSVRPADIPLTNFSQRLSSVFTPTGTDESGLGGGGGTTSIVSFLPRHRCSKICGILRPLPIQIALTCFTDTLTWLLSDMLSECQCHTVSVNMSRLECTHTSNDFSKINSPGSSHPPVEDDIRGKGLIDCRPLIYLFIFKQAQMYRFTFAEI